MKKDIEVVAQKVAKLIRNDSIPITPEDVISLIEVDYGVGLWKYLYDHNGDICVGDSNTNYKLIDDIMEHVSNKLEAYREISVVVAAKELLIYNDAYAIAIRDDVVYPRDEILTKLDVNQPYDERLSEMIELIHKGYDLSTMAHRPLDSDLPKIVRDQVEFGDYLPLIDAMSDKLNQAAGNYYSEPIGIVDYLGTPMRKYEFHVVENLHKDFLQGIPGGKQADLSNRYLHGLDIAGATLKNSKCHTATFSYCNMDFVDLSDSDLTDARFIEMDLTGLNVENSVLTNSSWHITTSARTSIGEGWELTDVLEERYEPNLMRQSEFNAICNSHKDWLQGLPGGTQADFSDRVLRKLDMEGVNLEQSKFVNTTIFDCYLDCATLANSDLTNSKFVNVNLHRTTLDNCLIVDANIYVLGQDYAGGWTCYNLDVSPDGDNEESIGEYIQYAIKHNLVNETFEGRTEHISHERKAILLDRLNLDVRVDIGDIIEDRSNINSRVCINSVSEVTTQKRDFGCLILHADVQNKSCFNEAQQLSKVFNEVELLMMRELEARDKAEALCINIESEDTQSDCEYED